MSNNSTSSNSGGVSFAGLLAILFIGLKLTGYINWSWWWVLSPLWISALIVLLILAGYGIGVGISAWTSARRWR